MKASQQIFISKCFEINTFLRFYAVASYLC